MDVGIGLPNAVRGVDRRGIVDWAKRAEDAGFSSLGTIDRIVFANYESFIALAAAAAVTERIRLATDVLLAPLRSNTALLAKQAATLDNLSEGRLVLGLAVGGRQDDYEASSVDFRTRGRTFEHQLEELERFWSEDSAVGPPTARGGRPELLIGGGADVVLPPRGPVRRRLDLRRRTARILRRGGGEAERRVAEGRARGRAAQGGPLLLRAGLRPGGPGGERARATTTRSSGTTPTRSWGARPRTPTP